MIIRNETAQDFDEISKVTAAAFEKHPKSHHTEQFIIKALRAAGALTVSLVAEVEGRVVGHVAFSPITVSDGAEGWYGLGPVSVCPEYQQHGIGTALINEGLNQLKGGGAQGCALVGDPGFYQRFGFRVVPELVHKDVPPEVFLILPFSQKIPHGSVVFHEAFSARA